MLFKAGREVANSVHHSLSIKDLVGKSTCGNQQTHTWGQFHKFNVIFTDFCNLHNLPLHDNNFQPYCCCFFIFLTPLSPWWVVMMIIRKYCLLLFFTWVSIYLSGGGGDDSTSKVTQYRIENMHKYQQKCKIIININAKACKFIKFWRRGFNHEGYTIRYKICTNINQQRCKINFIRLSTLWGWSSIVVNRQQWIKLSLNIIHFKQPSTTSVHTYVVFQKQISKLFVNIFHSPPTTLHDCWLSPSVQRQLN